MTNAQGPKRSGDGIPVTCYNSHYGHDEPTPAIAVARSASPCSPPSKTWPPRCAWSQPILPSSSRPRRRRECGRSEE